MSTQERGTEPSGEIIIPISERVTRSGEWHESRYRYADDVCLETGEDGAYLETTFEGSGLAIRFGQHDLPVYRGLTLGTVEVTVDGERVAVLRPRGEAREVVVTRGLAPGEHTVRLTHRADEDLVGARIEGLKILDENSGEISFAVSGDEAAFLVDARVTLTRAGRLVFNDIARNWVSGRCRVTGLDQGDDYAVRVSAIGWNEEQQSDVSIVAGRETELLPFYLGRDPRTTHRGFEFPHLGNPAIRRPGERFRIRFKGYDNTIEEVRMTQTVGPALTSHVLPFEEDSTRAFFYDRELMATVPEGIPPGKYDLFVMSGKDGNSWTVRSPSCLFVVAGYTSNPVLMTWGHFDTWGQYQAEYEQEVAKLANLLGVDMVLVSNAVNPAYISGALAELEVPYLINFGNHQYHGHEKWFGHPVNILDAGPNVAILNFGLAWHNDLALADALLTSRADANLKIINALEHNAPVESFLDKHGVQFIHDAHGPGQKVMTFGATPTQRAGKVNAESFRLIKFSGGRVVSCTYQGGDDQAPIPFPRDGKPPMRVYFDPANNGTHDRVTARIVNEFEESFVNCRLKIVVPRGRYALDRGRIQSTFDSDDGRYTVITVRFDVGADAQVDLTVSREP